MCFRQVFPFVFHTVLHHFMRVINLYLRTHLSLLLFSISVWVIMTLQRCPFTQSLPSRTQQTSRSSSLRTTDHSSYRNTLWWLCLQTVKMFCLDKHICQSRALGYESVMGLWRYGPPRQQTTACLLHFTCAETKHKPLCVWLAIDRKTYKCLLCPRFSSLLDPSSSLTSLLIDSHGVYWKEKYCLN